MAQNDQESDDTRDQSSKEKIKTKKAPITADQVLSILEIVDDLDLPRDRREGLKNCLANLLKTAQKTPWYSDVYIYRWTTLFLGATVIIVIIIAGAITLYTQQQVPDILTAIGSAAVGALAGLLVPPSMRQRSAS